MRDLNLENFIKLSHIKGVGFKFLKEFYDRYNTFGEDFERNLSEFLKEKTSPKRAEEILSHLRSEANFRPIFDFLKLHRVEVIPFFDENFPRELLDLGIPIPALYVIGELSADGFSIVGTRKASADGKFRAREFAAGLASAGYTVISGGAEGIDRHAHEGALAVGGRTGVILGEGLYHFVRRNGDFVQRVLKGGGFILSQFDLFTQGARWTFPLRNALIAYFGFYGTLVVEAPERSGALITADYALKLNRPLYSYLNCVHNPTFRGNLNLIKGCKAKLVTEVEELLDNLRGEGDTQTTPEGKGDVQPPEGGGKKSAPPEGRGEIDPLKGLLTEKPRTFDELIALTDLPPEELLERLTLLELEGKVSQEGGFYRWVD